jgi:signal transduction histidine kinase
VRSEVVAVDLLEQVAREWRLRAAERKVGIEIDVRPLELVLDVDPQRLQQVLDNLVANAVRHTPDGTNVVLGAAARDGHAELQVTDQGPGIPHEEAERVFERFYRADRARSVDDGGSGLGLAIARWIVELHGGSIRADEGAPSGCRMVVELPL